MASSFLSKPGTDLGPCADSCQHHDCAELRLMAAAVCLHCGDPIGYERGFYHRGGRDYEHAACAEQALDDSRLLLEPGVN